MRRHDWSATPLGPAERWPQSLRTTVAILLRSPVPIVLLWGPDGVMLYNDAYSVFAGGRHPQLLGSKVLEGWPEVASFNAHVMEVGLAGGTLAYEDQHLVLYRNGVAEDVWMNLDYSPVPGEDGKPAGVLAIVVETTKRNLAEQGLRESEERLEAELADSRRLQEISAQLVQEEDARALYEKITDAAVAIMRADFASMQMLHPERGAAGELRLLAFRGFDAHAAKFWEWVRADSQSTCGEALRTGRRATASDVERCDYMTGSEDLETYQHTGIRAVQTTPLVSRGGRLVGMLSTHWRRPHEPGERELRMLDVLARQAADLMERSRNQEALREADRRKDEFLATLSHELRNPLAPLRNAVQLLELAAGGDARIEPLRQMMERQVGHLVRLVDDLLEMSRISRGTLELRRSRVAVNDMVRHALETSQPLLKAARHQLSVALPGEPLWVDGDPVRLAQILANLLNNAAKYTAPGGRIAVVARKREGFVEVAVRDNGPGVAPEALPRLFEMFARGGGPDRGGQGGLGIGLALSRRLAEMHGGSLGAKSEGPGRGAEFMLTLPLAAPPQPGEVSPPTPAAQLPARRILVVDDNRDAAESLSLVLKFLGADVQVANDGRQALDAFQSYRPAVVFLDIGMPGMDGYEVARRMRAQQDGARPAIIALTGWGQQTDRQRAREAGFDHHLVKPADLGALQALLADMGVGTTIAPRG
ncbi:MAG TPA: ATP-binding protein [Burkholderiales bacterium]|nr:ATP-binding protein [Burkholderiales bacterium]